MKRFLLYVFLSVLLTFLAFGISGELKDFSQRAYWLLLLSSGVIGAAIWLSDIQWEWIIRLSERQSDDD